MASIINNVVVLVLLSLFALIDSTQILIHIRKFSPSSFLVDQGIIKQSNDKYAVIFDAGSTGSRVHVFRFDSNLNLQLIGDEYELFASIKPGLSSYENNPEAAAQSLKPLLDKALSVVPPELQYQVPVRVGATAGLRQLSGDTSERILEAVRQLMKSESGLKYEAAWVSILDGFQEGSYMWVSINYLLGNLGKKSLNNTVAIIDLGGGSVQMAYAISEETAANAPQSSDKYVQERDLNGTKYSLYAHSYLNYGLRAARAGILNLTGVHGNPCVTNGYQGTYNYSGNVYNVSSPQSGSNLRRCQALAKKNLKIDASCLHEKCTFNGVWNGGGGDGQKNIYIASYFYDFATYADIIKGTDKSAKIRPTDYLRKAKIACSAEINTDNILSKFPNLGKEDLPFFCLDLINLYTLLVNGFGLDSKKEVTVATKIDYKGSSPIGAAWPLGCAIDVLAIS